MLLKHCQFMHSTLQGACRNRTVTRPFNQPRDTDNKTTTQSPNRTYLLGQARAKTVFGAEASTGGRGVVSLMAAEDGTVDVPKRVEEALFYRLKQHGFKECRAYSDAYAECITGRVLSVAWKCRKEMRELSDCMSKHTGRLEELKARYVAAGSPSKPDWDKLLEGL